MNPFSTLARMAAGWPKTCIALGLGIFVYSILGILKVPFQMNPYLDNRDGQSKVHEWMKASHSQFADDMGLILFFRKDQDFSKAEVCRIHSWAIEFHNKNLFVKSWNTPLSIRGASNSGSVLLFPFLSELNCADLNGDQGETWSKNWERLQKTAWYPITIGKSPTEFSVQFVFDRELEDAEELQNNWTSQVADRAQALAKELGLPKEVLIGGPSSFDWSLNKAMKRDAILNLLVVLLLVILFRAFLGTWISSLMFMLTVVFSLSLCIGIMGWFRLPLNVLSNSLILMIAIAGIEDFLFLVLFSAARGVSRSIPESAAEVATPAFWTSFTTLIGFASLLFSPALIIREFGLSAAIGTLAEWIATFCFLPALSSILPAHWSWVRLDKAWVRFELLGKTKLRPRWAQGLTIVTCVLGALSFSFVNFDDDPSKNFPETHPQRELYEYMKSTRGWAGQLELLLPFSAESGMVSASRVSELASLAGKAHGIQFVRSGEEFAEEIRKSVSPDFASYVDSAFRGTSTFQMFESSQGMRRILLFTQSDAISSLRKTMADLEKICRAPECYLSGKSVRYVEISDQVVPAFLEGFWVSLLLVGAIVAGLALHLKQGSIGALVMTALWGPFAIFLLIAIFQIEMNLVTSLFAALVVGLAGDNAIQYIFAGANSRLSEGVARMGNISLLLTLILILTSAVFCFQTLVPVQSLGWLFMSSFLLNFIGDYFLLASWLSGSEKS